MKGEQIAEARQLQEVLSTLLAAGYQKLETLVVDSIDFQFDLMAINSDTDLVVVEAVSSKEAASRLGWNIQRVARSLDFGGSARSLSTVALAKVAISAETTSDILRYSRLLVVPHNVAQPEMRKWLSPLLPLSIDPPTQIDVEPIEPLRLDERFARYRRLLDAATRGEKQVGAELTRVLDAEFEEVVDQS